MLAAAGGFLDGFTYVGHGRVFANAMSGEFSAVSQLSGYNAASGFAEVRKRT